MHGEVAREVVPSASGKPAHLTMPALLITMSRPPELLDRRIDERLCAGRRGHVAVVGDRDSAGGDDLGGDGGRGFGVRSHSLHRATEIVDDDPRAPGGEQACIGSPDSASRAGDDGDAPLEAVLVHP